MFYLDKRIQGICDELRKLSIRQRVPISGWMYKKGNFIHPEDARHDAAAFSPFDCRNMHWYGPDEHYWFYSDTTVPESFQGKPLWMHVCTQIDEWDDGKNPQFLLFVNGEIVQGVDMNHRDVLLSRSAQAGQPLCLELQAYTGTLHTEFNLIVEFREIDPEIEGLYWDLQVPLQAFPRLEAESRSRMDLERVMNDAINLLDLRTPYSPAFEQSVHEARAYLQKHLYEERFVRHADSLRRELRAAGDDTLRWQTANRLFDSYITYNIDTAARYVGLMHNYADATGSREMKFLSTTCDVSVLIARNNIEEAYERILSLDTVGITRRMRASYYTQQMVVFGRLASGDGSEARRKVYADSLFRLRHTRIGFDGHSRVTRQRMYALELMDLNRYDEALEVLLPLYDPAKYNSRTLARIAYNIANAYYLLGTTQILARHGGDLRPANPRQGVPFPL